MSRPTTIGWAGAVQPNLILMGSRGRTGAAHRVLRSWADNRKNRRSRYAA